MRAIFEFTKGKLLCGLGSTNELWIVDYVAQTEEKLRNTEGPILSIQHFSKINVDLGDLFLIRETEWICILNVKTNSYTRILRISNYFVDGEPSQGLLALLPAIKNVDDERYNFAMVWGSRGNKVAKFSIDRRVVEYLG